MIFTLLPILVFFKVYAEELKGGNEVVQLTFRATNLDKKVQKEFNHALSIVRDDLYTCALCASHYVYNVFIGSLHKPKSYSVAVVVQFYPWFKFHFPLF